MRHMNHTLDIRRNFLFGGYKLEYSARYPVQRNSLPILIDGYFSRVYPVLVGADVHPELFDYKGRNPPDLLLPIASRPERDELFLLQGSAPTAAQKNGFTWEEFEIAGLSLFERFEGSHHIVHGVSIARSGALPGWVPLRLLGRVAPVRPSCFRFGIEHFRSSMFSASFGYTPTVSETILVDADSREVALRLVLETKGLKRDAVYERIPILEDVLSILGKATRVDAADQFANALLQRTEK